MVNIALFIDGENISAKHYDRIKDVAEKYGKICIARTYGIRNHDATRNWAEEADKDKLLRDIRLAGEHKRNKVDKHIIKEISDLCNSSRRIDVIMIATNDHGYANCVKNVKAKGKKCIVIGTKRASKKLRRVCSMFALLA